MIKPQYAEQVLQAKFEVTEGHFYPDNMAPVLGVYSNYAVKTYEGMLCPFHKTPWFIADYVNEADNMGGIKEFCMLHKVPIRINDDNEVDFIRVWKFIPALSSPISDKALDDLIEVWAVEILDRHEKQLTGDLEIDL